MQEGVDDQLARVGTITRARLIGPEISIEYAYVLDIPPLLNSTIYANRFDFDMPREFESDDEVLTLLLIEDEHMLD